MGGINFGCLAVSVPSPDCISHKLEVCDICQALRWSPRTWGREYGPCPDFASYTLTFVLQLGKNHAKTSVRVTEGRSADQRWTRYVKSTGLLAPTALGFCVRRRGQPSVSVNICWVAVLGSSSHQLTFESKLSVRALMWSANSGTPRTLCICLLLP